MTAETKTMLHDLEVVRMSAHKRAQAEEAVRNSAIILSWLGALFHLFGFGARAA
jgi:hypothetical protein